VADGILVAMRCRRVPPLFCAARIGGNAVAQAIKDAKYGLRMVITSIGG
jgi:hypothetical protein